MGDSGFSPINSSDYLHIENRFAVGGNALDKPTTGEKFKMFFAKAGSVLGGFLGSIARFFGPLGSAAATGLYGMKGIADRAIANMQAKREANASLDSQAASMSAQGMSYLTPGFSNFGNVAMGGNSSPSIEWAPNAQGYQKEITNTLNNKGAAASEAMSTL